MIGGRSRLADRLRPRTSPTPFRSKTVSGEDRAAAEHGGEVEAEEA